MKDLPEIELDWEAGKSPEIQLWVSVMQLAVADFMMEDNQNYDHYRNRQTAAAWISSESARAGGFRWVCYILGWDRHKVRKLLGVKESSIW